MEKRTTPMTMTTTRRRRIMLLKRTSKISSAAPMIFSVLSRSFWNVKYKLKGRFNDRYRSFTPESWVWSLVKAICRLLSCSRRWMPRMKARLTKHRLEASWSRMARGIWCLMTTSKRSAGVWITTTTVRCPSPTFLAACFPTLFTETSSP